MKEVHLAVTQVIIMKVKFAGVSIFNKGDNILTFLGFDYRNASLITF